MLHSINMLPMHNHKLETLYLFHGVKGQHGVIWGNSGQTLIFTKITLSPLCYIGYPCNSYTAISLRPSTNAMSQRSTWGDFPRQGTPSVTTTFVVISVVYFYPCTYIYARTYVYKEKSVLRFSDFDFSQAFPFQIYTVFVLPALAGKKHRDRSVPCCCCCLLL